MKPAENESLGDACPKCGAFSYQGGYCFQCGTYRPSKHNTHVPDMDASDFMKLGYGHCVSTTPATEEDLDEWLREDFMREKHRNKKRKAKARK